MNFHLFLQSSAGRQEGAETGYVRSIRHSRHPLASGYVPVFCILPLLLVMRKTRQKSRELFPAWLSVCTGNTKGNR